MHNAPSVLYPVGRCRFHAFVLLLLALAGLFVLWMWWSDTENPDAFQRWSGVGGALFWLGWLAWAIRHWQRSPMGRLHWDAQAPARGAWRWHAAGSSEATHLRGVEFVVDLQGLALLRLHDPVGSVRWAWVERRRDPAHWSDLRRALQSSSG